MLRFEPVLISTLIAALISLLISFGVQISDEQSSAILKFLDSLLALAPFGVAALVARQNVWSKKSVETVANMPIKDAEKILESKKG